MKTKYLVIAALVLGVGFMGLVVTGVSVWWIMSQREHRHRAPDRYQDGGEISEPLQRRCPAIEGLRDLGIRPLAALSLHSQQAEDEDSQLAVLVGSLTRGAKAPLNFCPQYIAQR
jgi:hypothetical protein